MKLPADNPIIMYSLMTCRPSPSPPSGLLKQPIHSLFTANLALSALFVLSNSNDPTWHSSGLTHNKLIKRWSDWQRRRSGWKESQEEMEEEKESASGELWMIKMSSQHIIPQLTGFTSSLHTEQHNDAQQIKSQCSYVRICFCHVNSEDEQKHNNLLSCGNENHNCDTRCNVSTEASLERSGLSSEIKVHKSKKVHREMSE